MLAIATHFVAGHAAAAAADDDADDDDVTQHVSSPGISSSQSTRREVLDC